MIIIKQMPSARGEKLEMEITTLTDAILFAEKIKDMDISHLKQKVEDVKTAFENGSWSLAEKKLTQMEDIQSQDWYLEYVGKRGQAIAKSGNPRFKMDGLCGKYGHHMVKVLLSNIRWYYICSFCDKRGRKASIR